MRNKFEHEIAYRGAETLARLGALHVTICGAGALGSHLADALARQGVSQLRVIDRDRVEESNVGTQLYGLHQVGTWKVEALRGQLFRCVGVEIDAVRKELTERNARSLVADTRLVVDAFDNHAARQAVQNACRARGVPCLHAGLGEQYGEVIWDERYRVPNPTALDPCAFPLARNLVQLLVAIAAEEVVRWVATGVRCDWSATLRDLAVQPLEAHVALRP